MSSSSLLARASSFARKSAILALAVPLVISQQGCTDDEVVAGLGVIAIVGGAIAVGSAVSNNNRDRADRHDRYDRHERHDRYGGGYGGGYGSCRSGHRRHCTSYYDRWGSQRQECREVYEGCRYYNSASLSLDLSSGNEDLGAQILALQNGRVGVRTANVVSAPVVTPQMVTVRLASKLGVSFEASEKLMSALEAGKAGNLSEITALGLGNDDLQRLASLRMITESGLQRLAQSLEIGVESARGAIATLIGELRTQAKDINSPYWKACTAGGAWKTPQNARCEETFWQGCSPQSGATMCAVAI